MSRRFRLTIKSKLILTLVLVTVAAVASVAWFAIRSGQDIIVEGVSRHLTSVRASKANQIEAYFRQLRNHVVTLAEDRTVVAAMRDFSASFEALGAAAVTDASRRAVEAHYREKVIPRLAENVAGEPQVEQYLPRDAAATWLQSRYIAENPHPLGEKAKLDAAPDGTAYDEAHASYHPLFRDIAARFGYYDLFLIGAGARAVVYSVSKEPDFAMPLDRGPYVGSGLARAMEAVLRSPDRGFVTVEDFDAYRPSLAAPAAFIATPVFDGARIIGVLALQLPVDQINAVMTGGGQWEADGLERTGETYLVGPDRLMRSNSRFLLETPQQYFAALADAGVNRARIENIRHFNTSILHQEVRTASVDAALANRSGTQVIVDYRGEPVLSVYAPLDIEGVDWVIVAEKDVAEAYAPMRRFARYTLISIAGAIFVVTLVAMWLSEAFSAPIRALIGDVRRVGAGEARRVGTGYRDEFASLAEAVNDTTDALQARADAAQEQGERSDALLQRLLPRTVIGALLEGSDTLAERHASVSVLFADVIGMSALAEAMAPGAYVEMLNRLIGAFDDAAQRHGVEKIATHGCDYMAASGVSVVRLDHVRCLMDFAVDMLSVTRRFNRDWNTDVSLAIGIAAGPVVGGVVGRDRLSYDLTGRTPRVAHLLQRNAEPNTIQVSDDVRESLGRTYPFSDAGVAHMSDGTPVRMWALDPRAGTVAPAAEQEA